MKNRRILLALLTLILIVGMIGCSSSGSNSGGSTPTPTPTPQTDTQKLVGTWNWASGPLSTSSLVFRADGTGSWGPGFTNGSIADGVFTCTFDSGVTEGFPITFSNSNNTITINNHGYDYTYSRA
jgi:hypothetical protein